MSGPHGDRLEMLAALVRDHLGVAARSELPAEPLDDASWRRLVREAGDHRIAGLLGVAVSSGRLPTTEAQRDDVDRELDRWAGHVVHVEDLAVRAVAALEAAGVDVRVTKGVAVAHTVYEDPGLRVFADVDLIVPSVSLEDAVDVLRTELDATRVLPELRAGFDREFAKEVLLGVANSYEIDLHRTLVPAPFGLRIPLEELFDTRPTFRLGGRDMAVLDPVHHTLHAAMSVTLADLPVRYATLADFALLVGRDDTNVARLVETARRWRQEVVLQRAVVLVREHLRLWNDTPLADWALSYRPSALERALLASNLAAGRTYLRQLAAVAVLPGAASRLRYLRALVAPSADYLDARGWRRGSHLRRGVARLRGRSS